MFRQGVISAHRSDGSLSGLCKVNDDTRGWRSPHTQTNRTRTNHASLGTAPGGASLLRCASIQPATSAKPRYAPRALHASAAVDGGGGPAEVATCITSIVTTNTVGPYLP